MQSRFQPMECSVRAAADFDKLEAAAQFRRVFIG